MFTREQSLEFLKEHNKEEMHLRHAFAVEAAMRGFAEHYGEDADYWGLIGLMHDIDWEEFPSTETHPVKGGEMLKEKGYPDDFVRAVLAHGGQGDPRRGWGYLDDPAKRLHQGFRAAERHRRTGNIAWAPQTGTTV